MMEDKDGIFVAIIDVIHIDFYCKPLRQTSMRLLVSFDIDIVLHVSHIAWWYQFDST